MKLKEYLRRHKIIYRTFAQELGITEQSLKTIMAGIRRPGLTLCIKIEKLTKGEITPHQLVEDYDKASAEKSRKKIQKPF